MTNSYAQVYPCYGAMLTGNGRPVQHRVFVRWGYAATILSGLAMLQASGIAGETISTV